MRALKKHVITIYVIAKMRILLMASVGLKHIQVYMYMSCTPFVVDRCTSVCVHLMYSMCCRLVH